MRLIPETRISRFNWRISRDCIAGLAESSVDMATSSRCVLIVKNTLVCFTCAEWKTVREAESINTVRNSHHGIFANLTTLFDLLIFSVSLIAFVFFLFVSHHEFMQLVSRKIRYSFGSLWDTQLSFAPCLRRQSYQLRRRKPRSSVSRVRRCITVNSQANIYSEAFFSAREPFLFVDTQSTNCRGTRLCAGIRGNAIQCSGSIYHERKALAGRQ